TLLEIILLTIPALLVLATAVWLLHMMSTRLISQIAKPDPAIEINAKVALQTASALKAWLDVEARKTNAASQTENSKATLPLRLQACERLVLMLERINLTSVLMRCGDSSQNVNQLEIGMLQSVRDEFEHNITQQLFVSAEVWHLIRIAREEAIALIKQASSGLAPEAPATELMVKIIEVQNNLAVSSTEQALNALREEVKQLF
ncbi:MAG: hypothetical protein CVU06_15430, partial [Bacteroidetes bacterium HGW-Bacteroidetes-22]